MKPTNKPKFKVGEVVDSNCDTLGWARAKVLERLGMETPPGLPRQQCYLLEKLDEPFIGCQTKFSEDHMRKIVK